jgi:hypothetical protein
MELLRYRRSCVTIFSHVELEWKKKRPIRGRGGWRSPRAG